MKKFVILLGLSGLSLLMLSKPAWGAEPGFYVGGGLGAYTLDIDDTNFDDNATIAKAFLGYQFGEYLAVEGEYQRLFSVEDDIVGINTELEADAVTVAVRPILPLGKIVDIYGKVGYTWYDVEAETAFLGSSFSANDSDTAISWGGGVDVHLGNVSLRGEVTRIGIDDADLNLVSLGVIVRF